MINHIRIVYGRKLAWIATAASVAVFTGQLFACWINLCGTSPGSLAALTLGFAVGVLLESWIGEGSPQQFPNQRRFPFVSIMFALAVIALSWLMPTLLNVTLLAGCETIGSTWPISTTLTMLFPACVVALVTTSAGLFFRSAGIRHERPWMDAALAGIPGGFILLIPVWLGLPVLPLAGLTTLTVIFAIVAQILRPAAEPTSIQPDNPQDLAAATRVKTSQYQVTLPFIAVGILTFAVIEILGRLMPGSLPVLIQAACVTSLALYVLTRQLTMKLLTTPAMQCIAMLTLALLPVVFEQAAWMNLSLNSSESAPLFVLLLRSLQFAAFTTAAIVPAVCVSPEIQKALSARTVIPSFGAGLVLAIAAVSQGVSPIVLLAAGILIHVATQTIQIFAQNHVPSGARTRYSTIRPFALSVVSLACTLILILGSVDTSHTSSLLFSERTAAAVQRGVERELIEQSHANRLVVSVSTPSGEVTVWQRTGCELEFQRNGMSIGRISTDTNVSPQPAEEILPAVISLASHPHPSRVLLLGDDTGVSLRACTRFPIQEIVAVRADHKITELAHRFTWSGQQLSPDQDERVQILHEPALVALRRRELKRFDVVIASGGGVNVPSAANQYTTEFYQAAHSRMTTDAVFCQRFRQTGLGPEPLKIAMATLMNVFVNVGVIQTMPGEILLLASDSKKGLIDPKLMSRLQRDHVRREIATSGWDWAQVAILPLLDARDPIGMFSHELPPQADSGTNCQLAMAIPFELQRRADKQSELHSAFGPHQQQVLAVIPSAEDREEVKRRMSALAQQLEILAGMPDEPWTYRKSLQMEMKQSPRPALESVKGGEITKVAHPLDLLRQQYFITLGKALKAASRGELNTMLISQLDTFTDKFEPLITHFAHYEIVRLHELANHPSPVEELHHRLHIVFFTSPSDASVRPVISAMEQLVNQPSLIADDQERYDMLNSLLQKMIERWEARTAWEPRSSIRVQNDVDMSVSVANRAMAQMEEVRDSGSADQTEFYRRRRFVNAALIGPLREYRDQVLAHRMKSETPVEQNTEEANDLPLLIDSGSGLNTN